MKNYINKKKQELSQWITSLIKGAVQDTLSSGLSEIQNLVSESVASEIEKLRYDYLPHGACWMCSMPVSKKGGYSMWRGKMFCTTSCFERYAQLIQRPDEKYRYFNGDPVEVFKPKN